MPSGKEDTAASRTLEGNIPELNNSRKAREPVMGSGGCHESEHTGLCAVGGDWSHSKIRAMFLRMTACHVGTM